MTGRHLDAAYPLSPIQQGMLFHSLYGHNTGIDVEQIVCTLHESIDAETLRFAWDETIRHHPELRVIFRWHDIEEPVQHVQTEVDLPFHTEDWREIPPGEQQQRLSESLLADRERGFDLDSGPLLRLHLFRFATTEWRLVWSFHHVIIDGRSFPTVLKEAFEIYDHRVEGRTVHLSAPRPFADFIDWLKRRDRSRDQEFWQEQLRGFSAPTPLPGAPSGPHDRELHDDWTRIEDRLSAECTAGLRRLAADHQITLNAIVQGAWAILLSRYANEPDVVFGATRACRHSTVDGAESMVGIFINTLPVRVHVTQSQARSHGTQWAAGGRRR